MAHQVYQACAWLSIATVTDVNQAMAPARSSTPGAGPFDLDDLGSEVGEGHGAEGTGPEAGDLDDPETLDRTAHDAPNNGFRSVGSVWSAAPSPSTVHRSLPLSTVATLDQPL